MNERTRRGLLKLLRELEDAWPPMAEAVPDQSPGPILAQRHVFAQQKDRLIDELVVSLGLMVANPDADWTAEINRLLDLLTEIRSATDLMFMEAREST